MMIPQNINMENFPHGNIPLQLPPNMIPISNEENGAPKVPNQIPPEK
jgi:hypothetical protein